MKLVSRCLVLPLAILFGGASLATACSWIDPLPPGLNTILNRKEKNRVTLHGFLVRKEAGIACDAPNVLLSFKVEKAFGINALKGDTLTLATPSNEAECGVDFPLGAEVVVFAGTGLSCNRPPDLMWTFLMSNDISGPSRSQLDSLYGMPPIAVNRSSGSRAKDAPAANSGWRSMSGITFPLWNGSAGSRCLADGRVVK